MAATKSKRDWTPVRINVTYARIGNRCSTIVVHDHRCVVSRYTGKSLYLDNHILLRHIVGEGYDKHWARNLRGRTKLELVLPRWLADEGGFDYDSYDMQLA
jgi:hypothetical protein